MRKRNGRKSRSNMLLDLRKLYVSGVTCDLFKAIEMPAPTELDLDIEFCEDILVRQPEHFEAMVLLGDCYTRRGDFKRGLEVDLRLSGIKPDNKLIRYNLACSYALTGQNEKAISSLNKAIELGYNDIDHLRQDRDLDVLKQDPRFQNILRHLKDQREREAV